MPRIERVAPSAMNGHLSANIKLIVKRNPICAISMETLTLDDMYARTPCQCDAGDWFPDRRTREVVYGGSMVVYGAAVMVKF
jgi:hypothetical protein